MKLFDRVVELTVGNTKITGLDIAFEIEKDLSPEPNPCHIEIYNLSEHNRKILSSAKSMPVVLKAGYKDKVGIIFKGDLMSCIHEKEGPSFKTVLASGDGALAVQTARISQSFAKQTPVKDVIKEVAKQLKLPCVGDIKSLESISDTLARGFCVDGPAMGELNYMLKKYGFTALVQNQALKIFKTNQAMSEKTISLTSDSGLLESPQIGLDKTLHIRSVLMPELMPGYKLHVESATFTGFAIIQKLRFIGANFGSEWGAEIFGKTN